MSLLAEFAARGRRILVVADNVNTAHQAELLLPTDGRNAAIVTSRHTLAMLNARLLDLNVLDIDGAVAMLDETLRIASPDHTTAALTRELHQMRPIEGLAYGRDGVRRAFELSYRALTPDSSTWSPARPPRGAHADTGRAVPTATSSLPDRPRP
ncbi:hypothetical protein [Actinomadura sp. K4S16]|uniref:hypothetical protein n=1 Tax=Actinomadura sp. K4S16 TaxID=1316147 RepID=UPI0011ED8FD6|nr:hypothetical protein [Actinomadura sp. K4S16]